MVTPAAFFQTVVCRGSSDSPRHPLEGGGLPSEGVRKRRWKPGSTEPSPGTAEPT